MQSYRIALLTLCRSLQGHLCVEDFSSSLFCSYDAPFLFFLQQKTTMFFSRSHVQTLSPNDCMEFDNRAAEFGNLHGSEVAHIVWNVFSVLFSVGVMEPMCVNMRNGINVPMV